MSESFNESVSCEIKSEEPDSRKDSEGKHLHTTAIIFSLKGGLGELARALEIFKKNEVILNHIESRPSKRFDESYEFIAECDNRYGNINQALEQLKAYSLYMTVSSRECKEVDTVPWFPRKIKDLDKFSEKLLYSAELEADHPGFSDPVYRARRKYFAEIANQYRYGMAIPRIEYTKAEVETWGMIFRHLTKLYPTHACKEHSRTFRLMTEHCGYKEDRIPQLEDVSNFLKESTGFSLRPVLGCLSPREFLGGLAFRVFHSTQFLRHPSKPFYTPEPDICHELLGHAPLFADPDFARFSQEIGLASLGASDENIEKLTTCYWFTVEFGLCRQNGEVRAYGAGLLSSFGELQYCLSGKPEIREFDPLQTGTQKYPLVGYQPVYYLAESFQDAQKKVREFASSLPRPFTIHYNPYTQSVEILDSRTQVEDLLSNLHTELELLLNALKKV